ncbi:MAG: C40 family peptidase [Fusobacteriaceae bacterium]
MFHKVIKLLFIFTSLFFVSCSSVRVSEKERERKVRIIKILDFHDAWKGTKYRFGGTTQSGVDCSGLIQILYKENFCIELPRTTWDISKKGVEIKKNSEWEVGDLLFYKIGRKKVRHVGVYIGENRFLHASTSKGVIISEISSYWRNNLWQVRKIL